MDVLQILKLLIVAYTIPTLIAIPSAAIIATVKTRKKAKAENRNMKISEWLKNSLFPFFMIVAFAGFFQLPVGIAIIERNIEPLLLLVAPVAVYLLFELVIHWFKKKRKKHSSDSQESQNL